MEDPGCSLEVRRVQGINTKNATFINNTTVCYPCGNFIVFIDIGTRKQSFLQCPTGSIRACSVNIQSEVVAFSNQKRKPSIFVYSYPGLARCAELKGGAVLDYSVLAFSYSGSYLASFSSAPDHVLTVWNWQEGIPLCSKSESNDTFTNLTFNPMNMLQLCSSSESSLLVWNIEVCDTVYRLKALPVNLPNEDGTMAMEDKNVDATTYQSYGGLVLPISAIAGLVDDSALRFIPKEKRKPVVQPSFHCWSSTSDIYLGCKGGQLLSINSETRKVTILSQKEPSSSEEQLIKAFHEDSIKTMALHKNGLYIAGMDGVVWLCSIKGSEFKVQECLDAKEPIESIDFSADYKMLSVATCKGTLYIHDTSRTEETQNILSVNNEDLLAADFLTSGNKCYLGIGISGELQVWSVEDGTRLGTLNLNIQATCMACCPSSSYAVVGSSDGHVYFIDVSRPQAPRIVQRITLYHVPVKHLHFDQEGRFLLSGASNGHIFIVNAKPSRSFLVLGCIEAGGDILSLSTMSSVVTQQMKALALICPVGEKNEEAGGTQLALFSLTEDVFSNPDKYRDERGMFNDQVIQKCQYEVEDPLCSAVFGSNANSVFGYCSYSPFIYKYVLPEKTNGDLVNLLTPEKKVRGSQLGPGFLCCSPHHKWLAVFAKDGMVYLHDSHNLEKFAQAHCHSYHTGGIQSLAFSLDGLRIVTTGIGDGALVYLRWKTTGNSRLREAYQHGQDLENSLQTGMEKEDKVLKKMTTWSSQATVSNNQEKETEDNPTSVEVTDHDDGYTRNSSLAANPTWLDQKMNEAIKKETQKYATEKDYLKQTIKKLRQRIQEMMRENDSLPDIEKLDQQEFNLDTEEQERLLAESEQEVERVRKEIELENLSKQYLRHVIKQECWDSMIVKGRSVASFHAKYEVNNYPLKEQSRKALDKLGQVLRVKQIAELDLKARKEIVELQTKVGTEEDDDAEDEDSKNKDTTSLTGSLSGHYGGDTSTLYNQLHINDREEKINQIILIQDIIYKVKKSFNKEFDLVCKQKEQEVSRVKERNERIMEIMAQLNVQEKILEPKFTDYEKPERALTVEDSEVKVEKYLTPEQKLLAEQVAKQEEEKRLAAQGDNAKQRALNDMMGGVLEVKKEDILRMDIPQPAFLSKSEEDWNEDEKKQFKEYDKKCKELNEEKEKYRKLLEAEMKKIQLSIMESTQGFDDTLSKLFQKKVKTEMVLYQEELKIRNLIFLLLNEEEITTRITQLNNILQRKRKQKIQTSEAVKTFKTEVDFFRESYDNLVVEDKFLDRGFRKDFQDISAQLVEHLYKLFKRRPRVQRLRTQTDSAAPFSDRPGSAMAYSESLAQLMQAMDEFDAPENIPEGLELPVWERFCKTRRSKMEIEQQVKRKAAVLAEMQAFLQRRIEEDEKMQRDIENIMQEISLLRNEKMKFQLSLVVQFLLKQGQVEIEIPDLIPNYQDALLLHRSAIEELNGRIQNVGELKIASMVECKDFRKGIFQLEWENKKIQMEMEDLKQKSRDITMLRVTKELQFFLNEPNYSKRVSEQISDLEETLNLQEKQHEKNVNGYKRIIRDLEKNINKKNQANSQLEKDLKDTLLSFSERKHIYDVVGSEQSSANSAKDRYRDIIKRRKLLDLEKAQAQEIAVLRAEVDRLRMKTFPALIQMEY
ncbi:cilia- and flagella-associated protein 43 [Pelobates fuscus]|uniref:cilia- and flagella-associated protein 43 n=1 Tax=Pelobates fuscus TaxID=191477 RepID=UPI002FE46AAA